MSPFQITAVAVCVGLNMLDGFDILVMAFSASSVTAEWTLSGKQLGTLLSAGLVGMAAGALILAPLADRYGRRSIILASVSITGIGMLGAGVCGSYGQLAALRVVTGFGIGGILASAAVIVSEYAPQRRRSTALSLYAAGYSLGATVGGAIAAVLIARYGWRSAFQFGGVASLAMLPAIYWRLPESFDFLAAQRPANALLQLNALLRAMHLPVLDALPPRDPGAGDVGPRTIRPGPPPLSRTTWLVWISFFFTMAAYYFVVGWTPRLLTAHGFTAQQGITGGVLLNLGGLLGSLVFAVLVARIDARWLTGIFLLLTAGAMALFAGAMSTLPVALVAAVLLGLFSNGVMCGFYSVVPVLYPTRIRATGMGWAIGVGRFGAILAPVIAGMLVDRGIQAPQLYLLFLVSLLVAAVALAGIRTPQARGPVARSVGR